MAFDARAVTRDFDEAIDRLEAALRDCPDDLWEASLWEVKWTDAWIWPSSGEPEPGRTDESIQVFSAVWMVTYHCLFYLDFYATHGHALLPDPRVSDDWRKGEEGVVSYDKRQWRKTSKTVRARDRYRALCGTTEDLTAHHLTPARLGLPPSVSDSVTLCRRCRGRLDGPRRARPRR